MCQLFWHPTDCGRSNFGILPLGECAASIRVVTIRPLRLRRIRGRRHQMSIDLTRRLLESSGAMFGASVITSRAAFSSGGPAQSESSPQRPIRLSFNENPCRPTASDTCGRDARTGHRHRPGAPAVCQLGAHYDRFARREPPRPSCTSTRFEVSGSRSSSRSPGRLPRVSHRRRSNHYLSPSRRHPCLLIAQRDNAPPRASESDLCGHSINEVERFFCKTAPAPESQRGDRRRLTPVLLRLLLPAAFSYLESKPQLARGQ